MATVLTSKELGLLVDQVMGTLTPDEPVHPDDVIRMIHENQLVPGDVIIDPRRVYHRLNNGRKTRYKAIGRSRFVRRLGIAWPKPEESLGMNPAGREVAACDADDLENLVEALLSRIGFKQVRFTNPISRQGDGGVDISAMLTMPVGPSVRHIVAVTGSRVDGKRLAQYRGLARQHERVLVVAHQISPKFRRWVNARRFSTLMVCLDASEVQVKLDEVKLTVPEAIRLGADMRRHQNHAAIEQAS